VPSPRPIARYAKVSKSATEDTYKETELVDNSGTEGLRAYGVRTIALLTFVDLRRAGAECQISYRTDPNSIPSTKASVHYLPPKSPIPTLASSHREEDETHTKCDEYSLSLNHMCYSSINMRYPAFSNCELSVKKVDRAVDGSY